MFLLVIFLLCLVSLLRESLFYLFSVLHGLVTVLTCVLGNFPFMKIPIHNNAIHIATINTVIKRVSSISIIFVVQS